MSLPASPPPDHEAIPSPAHLVPRAVPWNRALAWYEEAMRLWKRAPLMWAILAILTLVSEFATQAIPEAGSLLSKLVAPLVACGLLYASAAIDRGTRPSIMYAVLAFRAGGVAIASSIAASLVTFGAEAFAAWWIADANLLAPDSGDAGLSGTAIAGVYAIGVLASLPLTFVPLHVLFEKVSAGAAFTASWNAFVMNTAAFLVYGAASLLLLGFGVVTMGIGLVLVLPLWAASSYVAWKEIFAVREPPALP